MSVRRRLTGLRYLGLAGSVLLAAGAFQVGALPGRAQPRSLPGLTQIPGTLACLVGLVTLTVAWWRIGMSAGTGEPTRPGPTHSGPTHPGHINPGHINPERTNPERTNPERINPERTNPERTNPERTNPKRINPGRWMLATAALWALPPLLAAPPLASRDIYAYGCQGALVNAGLDQHAVGPAALPCPWLDSVPPIWRDAPSPYGPLAGALSAAAAAVAGGRVAIMIMALRLIAVAGVLLGLWGARRLIGAGGVSQTKAVWLGLACPLVALHVFSGAHNDALLTGLTIAACAVAIGGRAGPGRTGGGPHWTGSGPHWTGSGPHWTGSLAVRAILAGGLLGLAAAVKVTALVAAPFVVLLVLADGAANRRRAVRAGGLVAAGVAVAYTVPAVLTGLGLEFVHGLLRSGELAQWTSLPTAVGMSVGYVLRAFAVPAGYTMAVAAARLVGIAAALIVVVVVWRRAWSARPVPAVASTDSISAFPSAVAQRVRRAVAGAGICFAAVAALGPVAYPWYALTPLALLAVALPDQGDEVTGGRTRAWVGVVAGVLGFLILPDGTGLAPLTKLPGALLVSVLIVVAGWAAWRASRRIPTATASSAPAQNQRQDLQPGR